MWREKHAKSAGSCSDRLSSVAEATNTEPPQGVIREVFLATSRGYWVGTLPYSCPQIGFVHIPSTGEVGGRVRERSTRDSWSMKLAAGTGTAILLSSLVLLTPNAGPTAQDETDASTRAVVVQKGASEFYGWDDGGLTGQFVWPSGGEVPVLREFDPPEQAWLTGHRGVDLEMAEGADVLAAGAGRVVYAGKLNDRNLVSIEHDDGLRTTYEPVSPAVSKGDVVMKGQVIGVLETGHASSSISGAGAVLHWGAKYSGDRYIDPLSLLKLAPIRLWE